MRDTFYINASAMYNNHLYLTSCNYNGVFDMDFKHGTMKRLFMFPRNIRRMKFSSIYVDDDYMVFVPWSEKSIYVFDAKSSVLYESVLDGIEKMDKAKRKYEKSVLVMGNEIHAYMSSRKERSIVNLAPNNIRVSRGGDFDDNEKRKIGIKAIKTDRGEIMTRICYVDRKTYFTPLFKGDPVVIIDDHGGRQEIQLPDNIWIDEEIQFAFWYVEVTDRFIFFLPHEAYGIPYIDRRTGELFVTYIPTNDYESLRRDSCVDINDIYEYDDGYLAVSFQGNCVVLLDKNGNYKASISVDIESCEVTGFLKSNVNDVQGESVVNTLRDFISYQTNSEKKVVRHVLI